MRVDVEAKESEAFGVVPARVTEQWRTEERQSKVSHQAELLPCLLALAAQQKKLRGRHALLSVDNDAVRAVLVKGCDHQQRLCQDSVAIVGSCRIAPDLHLGGARSFSREPSGWPVLR